VKVFTQTKAQTLGPHYPIDHAVDLDPESKIPYGRIYNVTEIEFRSFQAYIQMNLANRFIQRSSSSAAAPILCSMKKYSGLQL
jgi:hypothetical protein